MKHTWLYSDLFQALKEQHLSLGFSTDGSLISASAVPDCGYRAKQKQEMINDKDIHDRSDKMINDKDIHDRPDKNLCSDILHHCRLIIISQKINQKTRLLTFHPLCFKVLHTGRDSGGWGGGGEQINVLNRPNVCQQRTHSTLMLIHVLARLAT